MKKHMSQDQEFEILKLVLDKFLWLGVGIIAWGFFKMVNASSDIWYGLSIVLAGAILLIIFMVMLVREYNYMK